MNTSNVPTSFRLKVCFQNKQKGETIAAFPTAGLRSVKAIIGMYGSVHVFLENSIPKFEIRLAYTWSKIQ